MAIIKTGRTIEVLFLSIYLCLLLAFQASAQEQARQDSDHDTPAIPMGIKGERIKALIATINSDDPDRVREFFQKHCTESFMNSYPISQHHDVFNVMYQDSGGMDI